VGLVVDGNNVVTLSISFLHMNSFKTDSQYYCFSRSDYITKPFLALVAFI